MSTLTYLDIPALSKQLQQAKEGVVVIGGTEIKVGTDPTKWQEVNEIAKQAANEVMSK